jgi:hypothetical protein
MTFPASLRSPIFSLSLAALCLLAACSHGLDTEAKHRKPDPNSSRFEWAVQHYEAGDFEKAIKSFEALRKEGAEIPDFDLVPFYLGMSHYKLGHFETAAQELEGFVQGASKREESQDARITLLLTLEKLGRWKDTAALAMESDKLTLFQYNRALLKLIWARSLRELGEILGAKAELEEAQPFLDKATSDEAVQPFFADPDQDLWGRSHFTSILVTESECLKLEPRDLAHREPAPEKPGKKSAAKKLKAVAPNRLYAPWLEAVTDCQRKASTEAADELFERESPWGPLAAAAISNSITIFGNRITGYLKEEASRLPRRRALQKDARENLYRLLALFEEKLKFFKNRELNEAPLEPLRKQVDRLLVEISSP